MHGVGLVWVGLVLFYPAVAFWTDRIFNFSLVLGVHCMSRIRCDVFFLSGRFFASDAARCIWIHRDPGVGVFLLISVDWGDWCVSFLETLLSGLPRSRGRYLFSSSLN